MDPIRHLLREIFNHDFADCKEPSDFQEKFFDFLLELEDLKKVFELVAAEKVLLGGKSIPAAIRIPGGVSGDAPFAILAQLHGNEPGGLAGITLAMALSTAGLLKRDVIGIVGNPLAAAQYFEALATNPDAKQEVRDAYRCGLSADGSLLPDMNRIPVDFMSRPADTPHIKRAQELFHIGQHISGILDIHTARGNMACITDHKHDADLQYSPIRAVLTELADAISAHASSEVKVKTLKTILGSLPNIKSQTGIEAGKHESADTPYNAAMFTLSLFYTLGISSVPALDMKETGEFVRYGVKPRLTYADLPADGDIGKDDKIYMAIGCTSVDHIPSRSDRVVVEKKGGAMAVQTVLEYIINPAGTLLAAIYQYEEMELIKDDQVVAVAIPSGTLLRSPRQFHGIFFSKSGTLYDKDPAVGPWPVPAGKIRDTKFCYPCEIGKMSIDF